MAMRRMFSLEIVDTDGFLDLPVPAQCLYFHLGMRADDDGFLSKVKVITSMVGCTQADLQALIDAGLILRFDTGVCAIRHWKVNNCIRKDRYHATICQEELRQLGLDASGAYFWQPDDNHLVANWETQDRLGKDRLGKDRLDKVREENVAADAAAHTSKRICRSHYGWIRLTDEEYDRLISDLGADETARCIQYVDESAQSTGNKNKWSDWNLVLRRCHRDRWGLGRETVPKMSAVSDYEDKDCFLMEEQIWNNGSSMP